jgi:hypothetical protein
VGVKFKHYGGFSRNELPFRVAAVRTLVRVGRSAESFASKRIRDVYNISKADVDTAITIRPATMDKLTTTLMVQGKRLPAIRFSASASLMRQGVFINVRKDRRSLIPGAFTATMPSGHLGIFKRREKNGRRERRSKNGRKYSTELPIIEEFRLSVANMFASRDVRPPLDKYVAERVAIEYDQQVNYLISQGEKKGQGAT